jgi:hypothetical protein
MMAKSGADIAHEHQAIVGTWDEAPSQGRFIGILAMVLMAFLVICALIGIFAAFKT